MNKNDALSSRDPRTYRAILLFQGNYRALGSPLLSFCTYRNHAFQEKLLAPPIFVLFCILLFELSYYFIVRLVMEHRFL